MLDKKWLWETVEKQRIDEITQKHNISQVLAELLIKRGISCEDIPAFLNPTIKDLHSPFEMKDMDRSVERIIAAIDAEEKILIFGDYDVDGITSTTVLYLGLRKLGALVEYYIPNRSEGYGLNKSALGEKIQEGINLVITVDCGISAVEEVDFCNQSNVDCIITDHHLPPAELPKAYSIINPKQSNCNYKFKELAGVGLSFKLVTALYEELGVQGWEELLDIVALGTVADLVPLQGENRTIVALGLEKMNKGLRLPLASLAEIAGVKPPLDSYHLGFAFGPRLNAAGRLETPKEAIELMLSTDKDKALELSTYLNEQNRERQEVEQKILEQCIEMVDEMNLSTSKVLVLANENWHHGVIGIVASRLVEKYYRPVIMLSINDDQDQAQATGSCRSVEGFHLYEALNYCGDLLVKYGGHAMAAGLTVDKNKISEFTHRINKYAVDNNIDQYLSPKIYIDMDLNPLELDLNLIKDINRLKPFGQQNPAPVFRVGNLQVAKFSLVGQQKNHLKVDFKIENMWISSIGFKKSDLVDRIFGKSKISFAGYLDENTYNGTTKLQLRIMDLKDEEDGYLSSDMKIIDLRNKSISEYLTLPNNLDKRYILYTNGYHKNRLDNFYLSQPNVIIKEYNEDYDISVKEIPVLLHTPIKAREFYDLLAKFRNLGVKQIIIGFGTDDVALLPQREFLVAMYQAIKVLSTNGKRATKRDIISQIDSKFAVDYLLDRGLNIFSECRLLHCNDDCWELVDVEVKVDYTTTTSYKKYTKEQDIFTKWHNRALTADINELLSNQQITIEEEE
ncbi:single-stranded-DNA-specific exonuclease RecJ [Alkalicella caledoniensis]|uniref:Single-stranded-DNA-specific exonuclease RecJ n=1 Tax=Alkalicella caledoniensis TaxID=2731377 RepID=A0A7G9WAN3_ALKCA|nr:single-stranded-DNA-specific exonuclease RecJ [Alkalicella caledoniensis]QNO15745.1 single-stranded-DNA-specific exonuclease RecJ [Alkalicella caledoniensis]